MRLLKKLIIILVVVFLVVTFKSRGLYAFKYIEYRIKYVIEDITYSIKINLIDSLKQDIQNILNK